MKRRSSATFKHGRPFRIRGKVVGKVTRAGPVFNDPRGARYLKSRMSSDGGGVDELINAEGALDEPPGADEGELCRRDDCCGRIMLEPSVGCTCHLGGAPCSSCLASRMHCPECGWTASGIDAA